MLFHFLWYDDLFESQVFVQLVQMIDVLDLLAEFNAGKKNIVGLNHVVLLNV